QPGQPLFVREGDRYVTNPVKSCFFNHQAFPVRKSPGERRIFCLGGSTTYGHPYDHRTAFGGWLQAYLDEAAVGGRWQVVNCGGISYASYRIAVLMEELVRYEPDLFIVYTGHNEFLEDRTYGAVRRQSRLLTGLVRAASHLRLYGLLEDAIRPRAAEPVSCLADEVTTRLEVVGLEAYRRDREWRRGVLEHFRASTTRIIEKARSAGAAVIFVQPAANLKDFTPFKSEHAESLVGESLERWRRLVQEGRHELANGDAGRAVAILGDAERLDPEHAQGLWLLGDALLAAGRPEEATSLFERARDEDVCPLRAVSEIGGILKDVTREQQVPLVDFPRLLADRHGAIAALGFDCFLDHVHPNFPAHAELGLSLAHSMAAGGLIDGFEVSPAAAARVEERVRGSLTPHDHVMALNTLAMTLSWAGKNTEALRLCEAAVEAAPRNAEVLSQYGRVLEKLARDGEAEEAYRRAVEADPQDSEALARLGNVYGRRNDLLAARTCLERAVELAPDKAPRAFRVRSRLQHGDCLRAQGDAEAAARVYAEAAGIDADFPGVQERLHGLRTTVAE
ncbi:MAG: tetratricopeptide repeat protein, partial [Planctomycetia bacterium]